MVAKRPRRQPVEGLTEYERGLRALQNAPVSDEDPADFWGADWEKTIEQGDADIAAGRAEFFGSTEEFLAALRAAARGG